MSYAKFYEDLKTRLCASRLCRPEEFHPCTEAELDAAERAVGQRLPDAYRWFLRTMGNGAGGFFRSTDIFVKSLPHVRAAALKLLQGEPRPTGTSIDLPAAALVFAIHQGYQFWYMDVASGGEDPPVWYFIEESEAPCQIHPRFTDFLLTEVAQMEQLLAEYPQLARS